MDVAGAIATVTAAIGFARELTSVDVQVDQAALKLKIAELTGALADAKLGLVDIAEELRTKDAEIARLSSFDLDLSNKTFFEGFWMDTFADGKLRGDPYCPYCVERKTGLFRVREVEKQGRPSRCPHCKNEFSNAPHYLWEQSQ